VSTEDDVFDIWVTAQAETTGTTEEVHSSCDWWFVQFGLCEKAR